MTRLPVHEGARIGSRVADAGRAYRQHRLPACHWRRRAPGHDKTGHAPPRQVLRSRCGKRRLARYGHTTPTTIKAQNELTWPAAARLAGTGHRRPVLLVMEVIVRHQDRGALRLDHRHNAAGRVERRGHGRTSAMPRVHSAAVDLASRGRRLSGSPSRRATRAFAHPCKEPPTGGWRAISDGWEHQGVGGLRLAG